MLGMDDFCHGCHSPPTPLFTFKCTKWAFSIISRNTANEISFLPDISPCNSDQGTTKGKQTEGSPFKGEGAEYVTLSDVGIKMAHNLNALQTHYT